jgi:hypothetical protein
LRGKKGQRPCFAPWLALPSRVFLLIFVTEWANKRPKGMGNCQTVLIRKYFWSHFFMRAQRLGLVFHLLNKRALKDV